MREFKRVVCWFSCGATSAVAAKIALEKYKNDYPVHVVYTDTGSEHPDNERFLNDVENWLGVKVEILKSEKYDDIWDVFEKTRWLVGPAGARCTTELKKKVRQSYEVLDEDLQVFGFDSGELNRIEKFQNNNPEVNLWTPLIDKNLSSNDCLGWIDKAGIEIPAMYKLGFNNNNCIGCVKGQGAYWNRIREHFPETFDRMAKVERELNVAINKTYAGDKKRKKLFLDEMPLDFGRDTPEPKIDCGLFCAAAYEEVEECDDL